MANRTCSLQCGSKIQKNYELEKEAHRPSRYSSSYYSYCFCNGQIGRYPHQRYRESEPSDQTSGHHQCQFWRKGQGLILGRDEWPYSNSASATDEEDCIGQCLERKRRILHIPIGTIQENPCACTAHKKHIQFNLILHHVESTRPTPLAKFQL